MVTSVRECCLDWGVGADVEVECPGAGARCPGQPRLCNLGEVKKTGPGLGGGAMPRAASNVKATGRPSLTRRGHARQPSANIIG